MVKEAARKSKEWAEYVGKQCKLVYEDGVEKDGAPHYSMKSGVLNKVTKTHIIITESKGGYTAINLLKVLRVEIK